MHAPGEESRPDVMEAAPSESSQPEPLRPLIAGRLEHTGSGVPFAGVEVRLTGREEESRSRSRMVIGRATTDASGVFSIFPNEERDAAVLACQLSCDPGMEVYCEAYDFDGAVVAKSGPLNNEAIRKSVVLAVEKTKPASREQLKTLSEFLQSSRRARVSELATDLARPAFDSPVRLFPVPVRAGLIESLSKGLGKNLGSEEKGFLELSGNSRFLNPIELASGKFMLEPLTPKPGPAVPIDVHSPIFGGFGWIQPDETSYRDYLRGVFVLYGHQQVLGAGGNLTQWTAVLERQLGVRFFQNFRVTDRTIGPLNRLIIPIVKKILVAPTGSGFGFAVPSSSTPAQGGMADRAYLDTLLALSTEKLPELERRYRLLLREPDTAVSSPVLLNVYTLKRVLSDTAQGPVEPKANVITPQIPGHEGKPILWDTVVGSAPFFLRYEEWLDKQKPFYPENLFSLRTQIQGYFYGGPWLDKPTNDFLKNQEAIPAVQTSITGYKPHFDSVDEVRRSATFMLAFGVVDAKLFEFIVAFDRSEFPKALRLLNEAAELLRSAVPKEKPGENWLPVETPNVNFPRSMSYVRRRKLAVTNITQLSGEVQNGPKGLELFFQAQRMGYSPGWEWFSTIRNFAEGRGLAARLVKYQRAFLIPMFRGMVLAALGDYASALGQFDAISGAYVGYGKLTTPAGAVYGDISTMTGAVYHEGSLPYTARVKWDGDFLADPVPFSRLGDSQGIADSGELGPTDLHAVEEEFVRLIQADTMLKWADLLYRTDDPSSLERARELYKGVIFLYGEDPGTAAYARLVLSVFPAMPELGNPLRKGHLERARLGLLQLDAGLNYYGYRVDLVPTLRYRTLRDAANRWAGAAKAAQSDYLAYMTRLEQLDLDILSARAQQNKARAQVQIASEQVEIMKVGIAVAQRLVKDVEARIEAKRKEIEDHNSLIGQLSDYFKGMKDTVSSIVDVGKGAKEGATTLGVVSEEEIKVAAKKLGSEAALGVGMGGVAVVGAFGAFTALSVMTLQGMADAATKRDGELASLRNEALPATQALVHVQERQVAIAILQESVASTELSYTTDLLTYHGERFLNRDF